MENGKCNMGNGPFVGYSAKSLVKRIFDNGSSVRLKKLEF